MIAEEMRRVHLSSDVLITVHSNETYDKETKEKQTSHAIHIDSYGGSKCADHKQMAAANVFSLAPFTLACCCLSTQFKNGARFSLATHSLVPLLRQSQMDQISLAQVFKACTRKRSLSLPRLAIVATSDAF